MNPAAAVHPDSPVDVAAISALSAALRAADRQVGGGALYACVPGYLSVEIGPRLVDASGSADASLFAAACSLTEFAGWMAHDGCNDTAAQRHFERAYRLACAAENDALVANVCASMSHLAGQLNQAKSAARIAEVGLRRATGRPGTAQLQTRLHAMRARGLAAHGERQATLAALRTAEQTLTTATGAPTPWIAGFDEASLAHEAALCLHQLGDLTGARTQAERVMAGMTDPDRWAYLAEGNATQARKRVATDVLIRDTGGNVLLVNPTYKPHWDLPGGMAEANEPPRAAAERELREELGLTLAVGRLLVIDWDGPHGPWDDQLVLIFDGGTLTRNRIRARHRSRTRRLRIRQPSAGPRSAAPRHRGTTRSRITSTTHGHNRLRRATPHLTERACRRPATSCGRASHGWSEPQRGSGGIRTPGPLRVSRFQGECIRPLCHASRMEGRSRRGA